MDQSSRASLESVVAPHVSDVPFSLTGQGAQAGVKIALAMSKNSDVARFVTIEEPENHQSHTNLTKLLSRIENIAGIEQQLSTNPRSTKNKKYDDANIIDWFREKEKIGKLTIFESNVTWRCHPKIAEFSDSIFGPSWNFKATESKNDKVTDHDGVFLLKSEHVTEYISRFQPQCLRYSVSSGKDFNLDFMNFKVSKGLTRQRVLIVPTEPIKKFVKNGTLLEASSASSFYEAVTRAVQSVAIVIDSAGNSPIRHWIP
ncbi:hypothetical protein [Undibacterium sp. TJN19]|uniref:hypothetical protein n=1 Tax=Undibacterium sp. TJN19 TaxID=3413055 RepID=UPI003BEF8D20